MNRPDILFIVLDTQRADRLGCYGHEGAVTPNLDEFAADSVLFESAISPSQWTIPSHASMFTGYYPTSHQVTQSSHSLGPDLPHMVEVIRDSGYETVGFCNNPLVGILNNGLKRGFEKFYNYSGAIPSVPGKSTGTPWPLNGLMESYTQFLRRISYPIQNFFGRSDLAFRISLNAWLTPLWSRFANFKGQNERSVQDVIRFLVQHEEESNRPLFLFLNLMETHLPYRPPARYVDQVAPYFSRTREAKRIKREWNREAYRWGAPVAEPLGELEGRVLSDLYDAEVAYQDNYLGRLFDVLGQRANRDDTLVLIAADHGDGLGDHGYFGHAFVAYQELVHVPLIIQWPRRLLSPARIHTPVSTRRIYHTILNAAGRLPDRANLDVAEVSRLTLMNSINGDDPEDGTAYSEVYPPLNFLRAIERHWPELVEPFGCRSLRRAIVRAEKDGVERKLIRVDGKPDELYNLAADPRELLDLMPARSAEVASLEKRLDLMISKAEKLRDQLTVGNAVDLDDARVLQQLRGLGYIE